MSAEQSHDVWVPVCCGRVMRHNRFMLKEGQGYGALVCTVCSKNITLEPEPMANLNSYGEGSRVLSVLGTPKPPMDDRRKTSSDESLDDRTL
jgi:hypothetical protein